MKIKGIIFDYDGTLVDSVDAYVNAYYNVLLKHNLKVSKKEISNLLGYTSMKIIKTLTGKHYKDEIYEDFLKEVHTSSFLNKIKPFPYVKETLRYFKRKGVKLFIFSGSNKERMLSVLERERITHYFDDIISTQADKVKEKPHPEGILKILEEHSLSKDEVVFVGDGILDYETSKNAGVKFIAFLGNYFNEENVRKLGVSWVVFFDELKALVQPKMLCFIGMPGSGKSTASRIAQDMTSFPYIRFGDITEEMLKEQNLEITEENERKIREEIRQKYGMDGYAKLNKDKIVQALEKHDAVIIDGLYSWEEYLYLKETFPEVSIKLICIISDRILRQMRLSNRETRSLKREDVYIRDLAEIKKLNKALPIAMADHYVVNNTSIDYLKAEIRNLLLKNFCL